MKETHARSIVKALSYRLLILILDFSFIYLFTKSIDIAAAFAVVSNIYSTVAYYLHERAWNTVGWGKTA